MCIRDSALALHCGGTVGAGGEVDGRLLLNDGHAVAIGRIGPGWALRYMDLAGTITGSVCLADSGYADLVRENPPGAGCALVGMGVHLRGSLYLDVRALVQHLSLIHISAPSLDQCCYRLRRQREEAVSPLGKDLDGQVTDDFQRGR